MHWKTLTRDRKGEDARISAPQNGSRLERMRRVEAALFLSREPISLRKIKQLADLSDQSETRMLVQLLNHYYDSVGKSFRVEGVASGYMLMTRPELSSWLRRLVPKRQQIRLSSPAMETLAVVAYRQPVVRAAIDAVRGVNCGEILRQLMEMDFVRISGRSEELGCPYLYSTTGRFLKHFGLNNLEELPKTKSMVELPEVFSRDPEAPQDMSNSERPLLDQQQEESKVKVTAGISDFDTATEGELWRKRASQPTNIDDDDDDDDWEDDDEDEDYDDEDYDDDDDLDDDLDDDDLEEDDLEDDDLEEEDEWEEVEDDLDSDDDSDDDGDDEWDDDDDEWDDDEDDWDDDDDEDEDWE